MHHYHHIYLLSVLAASLLGVLAKPPSPWDDMHIKHSWKVVPKNWEALGRPPSGTTIDLYIALKPQRENALVNALYEVSEPGHPRYRAYLTKDQVADLVAPHPETLELVNSWLEHHGISSSSISMTHGGNTLTLKAVPVTQANTLLGASYQLYRHIERGETIVRTVGYSLPAVLHWHVLTVAPTTSFVSLRTQWQTSWNLSDRAVKSTSGEPATMLSSRAKVNPVTPSFLRWLYDTEAYTPNTHGENVLGIVGFFGHYPSPADLGAFMRKFRSEAGPSGTDDDLESWLEYILDQENIPQTVSISYSIVEHFVSREYAINVCDQFAKLGVRGVSVLVSSGNNGIGDGTCMRDDGTVRFEPRFPGTCPYVTAVGGTTDYEPEVAAEFSGGGFSDYFQRPTYQEEAVSTFLQDLGNRYQGLYNASGRGISDIAAQAVGFRIFLNGKEYEVSGTSVATPVVAGIVALLNDWLILTGQEPLGFLNPWLYGRGSRSLTDITEGSNPGCKMDGFSAIIGWDPVTGLGTPSSRKMLELLF
ncbi:subtilisin-like protein [Lactarius vividus]|nr:subtilisin-like protein [Lactarius vividus]